MQLISYARHRFPPEIMACFVAICTLHIELWDVEELLAERGLEVSYV
jgi:transposase-like protein